ncbi:unnamed protein product [Meloidogyne enterolobii]|uniref:Uncharacterized protein n=1 Tax=Meloidogyne enterolobii TaxID=390850 RepID=A0ACB0ZGV5_MELEN
MGLQHFEKSFTSFLFSSKIFFSFSSFSKGSYFLSFLCVSLLIFSAFLYYFPNCDDSILKKEENKFLIEKQKEIQNQETFSINYKENQQNIITGLSVQPITSVVLYKGK